MSSQQVQQFYDELAGNYDAQRFAKPYHRQIDRLERTYVLDRVAPGASILEVGAGTGRFTVHLVEKARAVTVADVSAGMIERLRGRIRSPVLTTHCVDINRLDELAGYGSYDSVVCMRVLPHLADPVSSLAMLAGAVRPGGNVLFDLWNLVSFVGAVRMVFRRRSRVLTRFYSYPRMLQITTAAGLVVVDTLAWGYPRLGRWSLDRVGNALAKPLGYAIIFNAIRQ